MPSVVGWLDQSEEHQRKMREVIDLFSDTNARDELGTGVVRDALSDLLFPGLSTVQTRARYFLFVPWMYLELERKRTPSAQMADQARKLQTKLIYALTENGGGDGVIGIAAREKLKRLPSSVYWTGLGTFKIRRFRGEMSDYYRGIERFYRQSATATRHETEEATSSGRPHNWDLNLPTPPDDLLSEATLQLRYEESSYLRQRIVTAWPDTLLAHLILQAQPIGDDVVYPWDAFTETSASSTLKERVEYARWFSEIVSGAALLYNLLLAKEATQRNLQSGSDELVERYLSAIEEWANLMTARSTAIGNADRQRFWQLITRAGARVPESTKQFLDRWFDLAIDDPFGVQGSAAARELIVAREYQLKRGLARVQNPRQLELWGGSSGAGRLDYRWGTSRTMVNDIVNGLNRAGS